MEFLIGTKNVLVHSIFSSFQDNALFAVEMNHINQTTYKGR